MMNPKEDLGSSLDLLIFEISISQILQRELQEIGTKIPSTVQVRLACTVCSVEDTSESDHGVRFQSRDMSVASLDGESGR